MVEIIPAIMPKDYEDLDEKMSLFVGVVPFVQLDIMDGKFVPARTWPYPRDTHFYAIVAEEDDLDKVTAIVDNLFHLLQKEKRT